MRRFLFALWAIAPLAFAQTSFTYSYSGLPLPIYPDDWNTVTAVRLLVPKSMTVTKVTASVQVAYGGVGDLNVYLYSAAGTRTKLLEKNCGSLTNIDTTFDDSAPSMYKDFCPAEAGRGPFRGNEPLSNANGQNAYGYWRLAVENNGSGKTGTLNGFSITITGTESSVSAPPVISSGTIVSASNFKSGSVAPGEQLALFGVNLGPVAGVRAPSGNLPATLSGTTVLFDGTAAPLYYVSNNLVAVQAPTTLTPGANTTIQVISSSGTGTSVSLPVVPARPGIFTVESGGGGQARAINQDGTQNGDGSITGSDKAAPKGSVIQLFASGLGAVNPAIPAGTVAPTSPLSTVVAPVIATIGGVPATVTYAGAAPGLVGLSQVNVMVPASAPSGAARLVISVGGNFSQDEVTVQIAK